MARLEEEGGLGRGLEYWAYVYYLSKYYEFLDTVLIVLKKRPLILLHFYHHAIIPFLCWTWVATGWVHSIAWYGAAVNALVHVFMYSYYFLSQLCGYQPWWKRYITQGQLLQFFSVFLLIFVFVHYASLGHSGLYLRAFVEDLLGWVPYSSVSSSASLEFVAEHGGRCVGHPFAVIFAQAVNISFLFLFSMFYIDTYRRSPAKGKAAGQGNKGDASKTQTAGTSKKKQ